MPDLMEIYQSREDMVSFQSKFREKMDQECSVETGITVCHRSKEDGCLEGCAELPDEEDLYISSSSL